MNPKSVFTAGIAQLLGKYCEPTPEFTGMTKDWLAQKIYDSLEWEMDDLYRAGQRLAAEELRKLIIKEMEYRGCHDASAWNAVEQVCNGYVKSHPNQERI